MHQILFSDGIAVIAGELAATVRIEVVAVPEPIVPELLFL